MFQKRKISYVAEYLHKRQNTLILFHVHPDGDAIGSAFALKALLEMMGSRVRCVCADPVPERFDFIVGAEKTAVADVPAGFHPTRIVSVDTASPMQLGNLAELYKGRIDLMIDHHGKGTPYADNLIRPAVSATGEIIFELSRLFLKNGWIPSIPLSVDALIYMAISSDTGCFRYSNTTPITHKRAAQLLASGIDAADINHRLFGIKSMKQMQAEHAGFERMNLYAGGKVAVISFPYDLKRDLGAEDENLETLIDVARTVSGVGVAAAIRQPTDALLFRVSMRSSCEIDVASICAQFGGGGHIRAAGCTVEAGSIAEVELKIVAAVEEAYRRAQEERRL